jgi:hypothetical protein
VTKFHRDDFKEKLDLHEVARRNKRAGLELLALKVRSLTLLETSLDGVISWSTISMWMAWSVWHEVGGSGRRLRRRLYAKAERRVTRNSQRRFEGCGVERAKPSRHRGVHKQRTRSSLSSQWRRRNKRERLTSLLLRASDCFSGAR